MIRGVALGLTMALAAVPASASESAEYGPAFIDAFAAACVPERLSYQGTVANVESLGWTRAERSAHPELAKMMAVMDAGAEEAAEDMQASFEYGLYAKPVADMPHYLVVSRASFIVEELSEEEEPDPWIFIGCYLYNFDASAPIDPAPMTALTGNPISRESNQDGLVAYLWGPPCPMPRTGDSYLTFIAEDSPHAGQTGFSGLMVKFETSEPDEGEEVPDTYCTDETPSAQN